MRSSNPVLSRPDAFTPQQPVQGGFQQPYGYQQGFQPGQGYQQPGQYPNPYGPQDPVQATRGVMTIDDVITKSAITMGTVIGVAALTFMFMPARFLMAGLIISALAGFVTVMVVAARRVIKPGAVLAYAAVEGVFIGAVSKIYETAFNGIIPTAVLATLVAAAATLGAYKFFRIKVTNKFRKMVMIGTMAYAGVLLVNFVLSMFGLGFMFSHGNLALLLLISALGVGLAVFNLILDFDFIEQGIAMQAPESESWRAAFGLTVTMVWLYIEMLRLLSYFRSN
ncbi:Bax inhibitor-1/YccA family membrane protein [Micropruina sp.]|uniref:Bax inhibitor-1/YccA family protein n=1 Tax=Micropruina sp. TaxID=2737536 RepID=UPI0039E6BC90